MYNKAIKSGVFSPCLTVELRCQRVQQSKSGVFLYTSHKHYTTLSETWRRKNHIYTHICSAYVTVRPKCQSEQGKSGALPYARIINYTSYVRGEVKGEPYIHAFTLPPCQCRVNVNANNETSRSPSLFTAHTFTLFIRDGVKDEPYLKASILHNVQVQRKCQYEQQDKSKSFPVNRSYAIHHTLETG